MWPFKNCCFATKWCSFPRLLSKVPNKIFTTAWANKVKKLKICLFSLRSFHCHAGNIFGISLVTTGSVFHLVIKVRCTRIKTASENHAEGQNQVDHLKSTMVQLGWEISRRYLGASQSPFWCILSPGIKHPVLLLLWNDWLLLQSLGLWSSNRSILWYMRLHLSTGFLDRLWEN